MSGEELIAQHRAMVIGIAGRLRRELALQGGLDDLIAFGFGGLLEAKQRFDPGRGVRFQAFAYYRVRGAMLDGVRQMALLPRRIHERMKAEAPTEVTAAPTPMDRAFARISAGLTSASPLQGRYGEQSPESAFLRGESIALLLQALAELPERERFLVRGHYFEGRSFEELGRELGISKSWASRLHRQALTELRSVVESTA
jgi:RNA polymerase sigma factor for flagellar operon FliA